MRFALCATLQGTASFFMDDTGASVLRQVTLSPTSRSLVGSAFIAKILRKSSNCSFYRNLSLFAV